MRFLLLYAAVCYYVRAWFMLENLVGRWRTGVLDTHYVLEEVFFLLLAPVVVPLMLVGRLLGMGSRL